MNNCCFIGNLTQAPTIKKVGEKDLCQFRIAVNESADKVYFFSISVWGKQAEHCGKYLTKGSKVGIQGRLTYTQKDDKYYYDIVANNVEFLSPKTESPKAVKLDEVKEEDLPF